MIFDAADDQKLAAIFVGLHRSREGDLLALSKHDVADAITRSALRRSQHGALLRILIDAALAADIRRLLESLRTSGPNNLPPARLVGDWALSLGADSRTIRKALAAADGPVALAREYLRYGRIGAAEQSALEDIATAYGAAPKTSLTWIKAAVDAEIDNYIALVRDTDRPAGWWQRLRRLFGGAEQTASRS